MRVRHVIADIKEDIAIDKKLNNRLPSRSEYLRALFVPQLCCLMLYRLSHYFYLNNYRMLAKVVRNLNLFLFCIDIQPEAIIRGGCFIGHTVGIVIGPNVDIGKGCTIFQGVTLTAGKYVGEKLEKHHILHIGEKVNIFAGAKVYGKITIGDNVTIGANSVVLKSVPSRCTVAGIPAMPINSANKIETHI